MKTFGTADWARELERRGELLRVREQLSSDLELAADANIYRSVIRESQAIGTGADWRNPGTGDTVTAVREGQNGVRVTVGRGESAAGFYKLTLE